MAENQEPAAPRRITTRDGQGRDVVLVRPVRFSERYNIAAAAGENVENACAAALALCWPWLRKQLKPYNHKALDYGAAAMDFLAEQGVSIVDILTHGAEALRVCTEGLVDGREVDARANFSGAPRGSST